MTFPTQLDDKLFYHIARSHMYWGRKHTDGLYKILKYTQLKQGDIFLDPFCGGGTAVLVALSQGARVFASDVNPMAVFITKALIKPINLFALRDVFEKIRDNVSKKLLENYTIPCPACNKKAYFDFLKWSNKSGNDLPERAKIYCTRCNFSKLVHLNKSEVNNQLNKANIQPKFWFPKNKIHTRRKTKFNYFYELFTPRNLTSLAELLHAIDKISSGQNKELLHYVFTGMLYSCSLMQMFSKSQPTASSRGWTAPRLYLPTEHQEKNVWKTFEARFKTVLNCKKKINAILNFVHFSDSLKQFEISEDTVYIQEADFFKYSFPKNIRINHVFLDPPYKDDIDYLGFSEFWGSWLKMKFDFESQWNPGAISDGENAVKLQKILSRIKNNTDPSCVVTLAFGSKRDWMKDAVSSAGYDLRELSPILYDNSMKRGQRRAQERRNFTAIGQYFRLRQTQKKTRKRPAKFSEKHKNVLKFWFRIASFFANRLNQGKQPTPENIRLLADKLIPPRLQSFVKYFEQSEIEGWTKDPEINRNAYHRLCLTFLILILSKRKYKIFSAAASHFDDTELQGFFDIKNLPEPQGLARFADFEASNNSRNLIFCFYDSKNPEREKILEKIAERVKKADKYNFLKTCFLIVPSTEEMFEYRQNEWAVHWPRGFFICFNELIKKAKQIAPNEFGYLGLPIDNGEIFTSKKKIEIFNAEILKNSPVGEDKNSQHYKIKFKAKELQSVVPGQFVMIDTQEKSKKRKFNPPVLKSFSDLKRQSSYNITKPLSYLKRPFSIHRAFYEHFEEVYIKNISLPHELATITHTVFPNTFDIFYKVIDEGLGTNELKDLKGKDTIQMLGPLGRGQKLADLSLKDIQEVHLIGGGVGMAPLVLFGQGLRYYSFPIRAFIGIQNVSTLQYLDRSLGVQQKSSYVYIDDLKNIGLEGKHIYVAHETEEENYKLRPGLPKDNYHHGYVTDQYKMYLKNMDANKRKKVLAITCGPTPMIKALHNVTLKFNVLMQVLMEKRMGCGMGVCMSCVCPTKTNNQEQYSRVCVDGPLFYAEDIDWNKIK